MKSEVFKSPEGGIQITTIFSEAELVMVDRQIWANVVDRVSTILAEKIRMLLLLLLK